MISNSMENYVTYVLKRFLEAKTEFYLNSRSIASNEFCFFTIIESKELLENISFKKLSLWIYESLQFRVEIVVDLKLHKEALLYLQRSFKSQVWACMSIPLKEKAWALALEKANGDHSQGFTTKSLQKVNGK
jgi:hypothetical protein